ncbi:MAG: ABC transporter ATP-binding protein [Candidatus Omnitrophota bacterium]|jgi:ABC-type polysaccharide/polyol phosphate transport system ATPase subunit
MERITLDQVSKQFMINSKNNSALDSTIGFFSRKTKTRFWVLKNISFSAGAGENTGIIGKNGSGKSTLLRVIAGIYAVDSGKIETNGKIVYLNGLAPGLKKKLTVRENIYLIGSLLGLSQKDIQNKFNAIIEFSGVQEFVDTKVFKLSSGMVARFAFSATIHFVEHRNPDIILLDEVFGAGADADFQKKAIHRMEELINSGATVLLASHNLDLIKTYCHRAIWIDKGEISKLGEAKDVCEAYAAFTTV